MSNYIEGKIRMGWVIFILIAFFGWCIWYSKNHPEEMKKYQERQLQEQQQKQNPLQIHCPTCGSTNVEKISGASKVGKAVAYGVLAAGSISKTFHCKNCGYKW